MNSESALKSTYRRSRAHQLRGLVVVLTIVFCYFITGCAMPKRAHLIVPSRCMKLTATSFTRPCTQRPDGKLVCDGVVVQASCIKVVGN
jgi:hypothetical protein